MTLQNFKDKLQFYRFTDKFMNNFIHDCSLTIVLHHNASMILDFTMPYYLFFILFMIRWLTSVHLTPSGYLPPRVSESRNVAAVFFYVVLLEEILYNSCNNNNNKKELEGCIRICESPCLWLISQSS